MVSACSQKTTALKRALDDQRCLHAVRRQQLLMVFACSEETPDFGGVFMQSGETQQVLMVSAM